MTVLALRLALLLACAAREPAPPPESVKIHGNLPIKTASELAAEEAERAACLAPCTDDACRAACMERFPIVQVEVVPDAPQAP